MFRMFRTLVPVAAATAALLVGTPAVADTAPSSMAALGDSITRGFDSCGWFTDCPSRSFSTGTDTAVDSHYQRILARNSAISGHAYNDARSGAKIADLAGQVSTAVGQHAQYVTILMGANDACTKTEAAMTPVSTFEST